MILQENEMGLLKDAGDSIIKYSEIIVNKTEEYTKIAKLTLDIKGLESDIKTVERDLGNCIIKKMEQGEFDAYKDDEILIKFIDKFKSINNTIESKKNEINQIKTEDKKNGKTQN